MHLGSTARSLQCMGRKTSVILIQQTYCRHRGQRSVIDGEEQKQCEHRSDHHNDYFHNVCGRASMIDDTSVRWSLETVGLH